MIPHTRRTIPNLEPLEGRETPATDLFGVTTDAGIAVQAALFDANGNLLRTLQPFGGFTGGATVATGDMTGDGVDDLAVGAGPGGGPHVKVFDGTTGQKVQSFYAFDPAFTGGVFVGVGDVTGDGRGDVVVGAGGGGGPHVKVFDGVTTATVRSFFAYDPAFLGGVSVRAGDTNADGRADIVTGTGVGGGPHVKVFSGADLSVLQSFFADDAAGRGGVLVGIGDFTLGRLPEIVGSVNGRVHVFAGQTNSLLPYIEQDSFVPFAAGVRTQPAAIRQDNGIIAVLVGAAPVPGSTRVKIVDGTSNTIRDGTSNITDGTSNTIRTVAPFGPNFTGGVFVG